MIHLIPDLRYALRSFTTSPVFTAVALISLALGIGANTAIFTLMDQVILRGLPVEEPDQLVLLSWRGMHYGSNTGMNSLSYPMYRDIRDQNQVFTGMLCRYATALSVSHSGQTERVAGELVSGNYYQILGVRAAIGRLISPDDDRLPGAGTVAVLSYDYWRNRFNRDPSILGQTIRLNGFPMTIVGVVERRFHGVDLGYNPQVMAPVTMKKYMTPNWDDLEQRRQRWVQVFGRLKPGVSIDQAKASVQPIFKAIINMEVQQSAFSRATQYTKNRFLQSTMDLLPGARGRPQFRDRFQAPLVVLMSIVGLVLLIACANVANLSLARATARQKEMAVRLAMGARRIRIISQLLTESILLSVFGGIAGLLFAFWLDSYLLSVLPQGSSPLAINASPDLRVFAFTFGIAVLTGIIFGLAPAFEGMKAELAYTLKDQAGSITGTGALRLRKCLVVAQVTLSLLLLIGSGLFIRSLQNLRSLDPGFRPTHLVSFSIDPMLNGYEKPRARNLLTELHRAIASLPGVEKAALSRIRLLDGNQSDSSVTVEGYRAKDGEDMSPWVNTVSPGYFSTLGIP
jgi:predicted permease